MLIFNQYKKEVAIDRSIFFSLTDIIRDNITVIVKDNITVIIKDNNIITLRQLLLQNKEEGICHTD